MPNRLAEETSPYLKQHAENPVDWYPWGDEAFERARREDKPVFLSVGYSACHWCHVMERESFEDPKTASLLNANFVSIKVDREERPDVDSIYMDAVQALLGHGGWPMSVFMTPDMEPFYGGTYFPDKPRHGMPAFSEILTRIAELWADERDELIDAAESLSDALRQRTAMGGMGRSGENLEQRTLETAVQGLSTGFDTRHGGWGPAPKFPQPAVLEYLLRRYTQSKDEQLLDMVTLTLRAMGRGGVYDQLGGGFHRYSTDDRWLVPHFEKMLYDNAQLARVYLYTWQVTGESEFRRIAEETLDYVAREMTDAAGGFYSAQDADTEGEEGKYFVWTAEEIRAIIDAESENPDCDYTTFCETYGITEYGNFEGKNVLALKHPVNEVAQAEHTLQGLVISSLKSVKHELLRVREDRVRPGLDDKVLTGWNGLMLAAFAEGARILGREDYRRIAERNAEFVLAQVRTQDGRMLHSWQGGRAKLNGYLEDYSFYAFGLLELYQTTFDDRWFIAARELCDVILEHFGDSEGGFFDTSDDHEALLMRPKDLEDLAIPSGGSVAAEVLMKMTEFTGESRYAQAAEDAIRQVQKLMTAAPLAFARWLSVLDFALAPPQGIAIVGDDAEPLLRLVRQQYRPNSVVASTTGTAAQGRPAVALLENRGEAGRTCAYVCKGFTCERPVCSPDELAQVLEPRVPVGAANR